MELQGAIEIRQQDRLLKADSARFQVGQRQLTLDGSVSLQNPAFRLAGSSGSFNLRESDGQFYQSRFQLNNSDANGRAESISIISGERIDLDDATFTTCRADDPDWELVTSRLRLDQANNLGTAYHPYIRFKGVPIFYLPWVSFPLQGRQSGVLMPTLGFRERTGQDIRQPWYWNIASQADATLTPRWLEDRGTILESEWRLLTREQESRLLLDYLPEDRGREEEDRRYLIHFDYQFSNERGWSAVIQTTHLSDVDYLDDFGAHSGIDVDRPKQSAQLDYRQESWQADISTLGYADSGSGEQYRMLPQIQLQWSKGSDNGPTYALQGQISRFVHHDSAPVEGIRLFLQPEVGYHLQSHWGNLESRFLLQERQYRLDKETISSTIPLFTLDGSLYFERAIWGDGVQTLVPAIGLRSIKDVEQQQQPLFDTSPVAFSWAQITADNRYVGSDRQQGMNLMSFTLSSSWINSAGREVVRGRMGKLVEFSKTQESAPGLWEGLGYNNWLSEFEWRPGLPLSFSYQQQFTEKGDPVSLTGGIGYNHSGYILNITYREDAQSQLRQIEWQGEYQLSSSWQFQHDWLYDQREDRSQDLQLGLNYRNCCWGLRLAYRQELQAESEQLEESWYLQLELKGLGNLGRALNLPSAE